MADSKMQLADWFDDLCVRFIINLPREELESVERICFQVEEAQWFYEDFVRPLDPSLPSINLRTFCLRIFQHCPLLSQFSADHHLTAFSEFLAYKTRVPVRGAIMLNEVMDSVVLVKGWKKNASWSFPRGKINKDEKDLDCAIREVYEETGFDLRSADLVKDEQEMKFIEVTMREQHMRLYVFRGVPMDAYFEPRTRKEISKIDWYKLSDLPAFKKAKQKDGGDEIEKANKFYMVAPFLPPLKKWIAQQKRRENRILQEHQGLHASEDVHEDEALLDDASGLEFSNDNMDRLLAGLRSSRQPSALGLASELADVRDSDQGSAMLGSLLNLGASEAPQQQAVPIEKEKEKEKANALLSLLQKGSTPSRQITGQPSPSLRIPSEHVAERTPEPYNPFHHDLRPSQPSDFPLTPSFLLSPSHSIHPQQTQVFQAPPSGPALDCNTTYLAPSHLRFTTAPESRPTQNSEPSFARNAGTMRGYHNSSQEQPGPVQQTQGISIGEAYRPNTIQKPTAPAASKLPLPKLTEHTLSLLQAFKSNGETRQIAPDNYLRSLRERRDATSILQDEGRSLTLHTLSPSPQHRPEAVAVDQSPPYEPQIPNVMSPTTQSHSQSNTIRSRPEIQSLATFTNDQAGPTKEVVNTTMQLPSKPLSPSASAAKPRVSRQEALLEFFLSPSPTVPALSSQSDSQQRMMSTSHPVELSAHTSPGVRTLHSAVQGRVQAPSSRVADPAASSDLRPAHPEQTAATVSGPLQNPAFESPIGGTKAVDNRSQSFSARAQTTPSKEHTARVSAWQQLPAQLAKKDQEATSSPQTTGGSPSRVPRMHETYRQVPEAGAPGRRPVTAVAKNTHEAHTTGSPRKTSEPKPSKVPSYARAVDGREDSKASPSASMKSGSAVPKPIQILQRPSSSARTQSPTTPQQKNPAPSPLGKARPKADVPKQDLPKPFQPKILRRPAQVPSTEDNVDTPVALVTSEAPISPVNTSVGNEDRPSPKCGEHTSEARKKALLSLFSVPTSQAATEPRPATEVTSPREANLLDLLRRPTKEDASKPRADRTTSSSRLPIEHHRQSRAGSIVSATATKSPTPAALFRPFGQPLGPQGTATRSRLNSLASSKIADDVPERRGSTPVSPVDKNFLLGYLEGVLKGK